MTDAPAPGNDNKSATVPNGVVQQPEYQSGSRDDTSVQYRCAVGDFATNGIHGEPAAKRRHIELPSRWFSGMADSGTNVHTVNNKDLLIAHKRYFVPKTISVASGAKVRAFGEGRLCLRLQASHAKSTGTAPMHLTLNRVLFVPDFKSNYLNTSDIRKNGVRIVGDDASCRLVDPITNLQYAMPERGGQEYIDGTALTTSEYEAVSGLEHLVTNHVDGEPSTNSQKAKRKRVRRSVKKLSTAQLKQVVHAPASDTRFDPHTREAARLELCRSGTYTYTHGQSDLLLKQHHVLGHPSMQTTVRTLKSMGLIEKLDKGAKLFCESCLTARPRRQPVGKMSTTEHKNALFSKFFADVAGPFTPAIHTKNRFVLTVIERHSGNAWNYYMQDTAQVPMYFEKFLKHITYTMKASGVENVSLQLGKSLCQFDNASYFSSKAFGTLIAKSALHKVHGVAYAPGHQAKIERHFGTIKNRSRSMLSAAGYDPQGEFWEMAWRATSATFNYLDNKTTIYAYSPYQVITGESPNPVLAAMRPFGCRAVMTTIKGSKTVTRNVTYMGPFIDMTSPGKVSGHFVYDANSPIKIKRVHHVQTLDEVPRKMADESIINITSKHEDSSDALMWSVHDEHEGTMPTAPVSTTDPWEPPADGDWIQPDQIDPAITIAIADEEASSAGDFPSADAPSHVPGEWINIDSYEQDMQWKNSLSNTLSVHSLVETEVVTMGASVFAASVTDTIHYSRASAMADNPGCAASDAKEMKAMKG